MKPFANCFSAIQRCASTLIVSAVALGLAPITQAFAATVTVGNNTTACQYSTIHDAISAANSGDTITIEPSHTYTEHLTIANKSLTLKSCACPATICHLFPSPAPAVVSGAGGAYVPTLAISGTSNVTLTGLEVRDGHTPTDGGGIAYVGTGTLTLNDVLVDSNFGGNGGGVGVTAQGGLVTVNLNSNTKINNNIAQVSGGGIFLKGLSDTVGSDLTLNPGTQVNGNTAQGSGGGLEIEGAAELLTQSNVLISANMAPNGYGGGINFVTPAFALMSGELIQGNKAEYGGGIAVESNKDISFDGDIQGNTATQQGGGVYLSDGVSFTASNYHIDNNVAVSGSAIFTTGTGALNLENSACSAGECNTISYNQNRDANNVLADGSTIKKTGGDYFAFSADGLHMRFNIGSHLMDMQGPSTVQNALLVDNQTSGQLLYNAYGTGIEGATWSRCTVAHNTIGSSAFGPWPVFAFVGYLRIYDSIIGQPDHRAVASAGGGLDFSASTILANDIDGLDSGTPIQADPAFVDDENGDFHLLAERVNGVAYFSPAIDAVFTESVGNDVDHRPWPQDIAGTGGSAANHVVGDLGAYEMQPYADRLFTDGFGDPLRLAY